MDANDMTRRQAELDDFNPAIRRAALAELAAAMREGGAFAGAARPPGHANVHFHTFYSFNIAGWSPSRVAWEAAARGLEVAGIVDFDVLDGVGEILEAGDLLGLRACASLETRVYRADYADREINSPGEPGVTYFMAAGFVRVPEPGSAAAEILAGLRRRAEARNREVASRVNAVLGAAAIDYDADVLPLTPAGNATERHLLAAYDAKAREVFPERRELAEFWAGVLGLPNPGGAAAGADWLDDQAVFRTLMRAKLMKKGGPGYVAPDADSFPPLADVVELARGAGALPCAAWLDGTSAGEAPVDELLDGYAAAGARALAIVPERNWNIADAAKKKVKLDNLAAVVAGAKRRGLVLAVGTEMNNYGQPFADAFTAPELAPFARDFLEGAYILYGHGVLERFGRMGMGSEWAKRSFGGDSAAANNFYLAFGRQAAPGPDAAARFARLSGDMAPAQVLE